jgi:hypothetical protein
MIEFEHVLFKLLLLVAVLSAKPPGRKWLPFIIAGGFLLAFLPPGLSVAVPWDLILGLTVPLLLWQNARRIIAAQSNIDWKDLLIWIVTATVFALVFWSIKELELFGAILFGLIAASMIWSVGEKEKSASIVSIIGPFTLIFLLAEVEPMIQTPTRYIGGIFSGLSFGGIIAFLAIYVSKKTNPTFKNWITVGQIYLAYGFAYFTGVSAVAASLASVIVYVTAGIYMGLLPYRKLEPAPLNTWPGFIIILVLFMFLGWQAHYPPSNLILLEVITGFALSLLIAWMGQHLKLEAFPQHVPLWRIGLRVALLLFPALLIWPRETLQQPMLLVYALGIAVFNLIVIRLTFDYFFD